MMRRVCSALAALCLFACAPTRGVYLGSDVFPDAGQPVDASPEHDAAKMEPKLDAEPPGSPPDDAGRPMQRDATTTPPPPEPLRCASGTADCDEDAGNGCEIDLIQDSKHCGQCGVGCPTSDCACQNGRLVTICTTGHADCDSNPANGCEVNTQTSMQHCGSCGRLCHTNGHDAITATCVKGRCEITCQSELFPELDCDGNPDNGCETSIWTDNQNCGACGVRCTCVDGICT
jgi:hypothetical protein